MAETTAHRFVMPRHGEVWQHFKGEFYKIHHVGLQTEDCRPEVCYYKSSDEAVLESRGPEAVEWFHRDLGWFLGSCKDEAGSNVYRFARTETSRYSDR